MVVLSKTRKLQNTNEKFKTEIYKHLHYAYIKKNDLRISVSAETMEETFCKKHLVFIITQITVVNLTCHSVNGGSHDNTSIIFSEMFLKIV